MKPFDWEKLCREQHIPYVESGPNVKRGEISIQCPFCGTADPSHHMGLSRETGWWSCWRNRSMHSGKSPLRLIMKLLRVPYARAREIAGLGADYVDPEGFDAIAARILSEHRDSARVDNTERRFLRLDPEFIGISERVRTRRYWNYLYQRGFNGRDHRRFPDVEDVDALCKMYCLSAGVKGVWTDRIIMPYFQDGKLVTWTARAIGTATVRYRDLSLEDSLVPAKHTLYNHDAILDGGKVLVIQEGPFDVLKVDFYGRDIGVRSVGLSTGSISEEQSFLLHNAVDKFDRIIVMMDTKHQLDIVDSIRMKQALRFLGEIEIAEVPFGAGDAGAMTVQQVIGWTNDLIQGPEQ